MAVLITCSGNWQSCEKLTDVKRTDVLKAIFGDDAETIQVVNALIDKGKDGYDQIQQKMNKQASLNKRVQAQLGTLSNLWEAMTGTATNGLAAIGGAFSGDAKNITQWLGSWGRNSRSLRMKIPGYSRRRRACCRSCDSETGIDGRGQCHQYCQQDYVDDADWHDCDGDCSGCGINYH